MSDTVVGIRHALPDDKDYVEATWLRHYWEEGIGLSSVDREVFYRCQRKIIQRLMAKHTTIVAYDPADPRVIVGFITGDDYPSATIVHYAYVRFKLRRFGVGKAMLEHLGWLPGKPIMGTHQTKSAMILRGHFALLYNPYLQQEEFAGGLRGRTTRGIQESE